MTKIKICGLSRADDVAAAVRLGADMLGFIHVPHSPRFLDLAALDRLLKAVPAGRTRVIVVQNETPARLDRLRRELTFDWFQFHGDEDQGHLTRWGGYRVFHVSGEGPAEAGLSATFGSPFLLDTTVAGRRGGLGRSFDWSVLAGVRGEFMVAGGLNPENVAGLIRTYRPWGVDISSGIESEPGVKDHDRMKRFIENVRRVSYERDLQST